MANGRPADGPILPGHRGQLGRELVWARSAIDLIDLLCTGTCASLPLHTIQFVVFFTATIVCDFSTANEKFKPCQNI